MYSASPIMRSLGLHSLLPGTIFVILAALLLSWLQLRRLTSTGSTAVDRWLPGTAIAAGCISFVLIAVRFIGIA
jgi:hypothetical protein